MIKEKIIPYLKTKGISNGSPHLIGKYLLLINITPQIDKNKRLFEKKNGKYAADITMGAINKSEKGL